jgi:Family of unknown function (DUF5995)
MTSHTNARGAVVATSANRKRNWTVGKRTGSSAMSASAPPPPAVPMERLGKCSNLDDVVRNLDQIIEWSIRTQSTMGYFAVLYKRSTVAISRAINEGKFKDREVMERFDVVFAQRYFDAVNAYFYPGEYPGLTLPWEVAFVGHVVGHSTMLQHMVVGLNAHINYDLGIATAQIVPNAMKAFEHDFNFINALVASQIQGMLDVVQDLSPAVVWIRRVIPDEIGFIKKVLVKFRTSGWFFAIYLAMNPDKAREKKVNQRSWTAALGAWYLDPPTYWRAVVPKLLGAIAKRESRDVAKNLRALNEIANHPSELEERFLDPPTRDRSLTR